MPLSRDEIFRNIQPHTSTHAGLWLDKYLGGTGDEAKKLLVKDVTEIIKVSDLYRRFYERWKISLEQSGAQFKQAKTLGRLAINLGAESVLETSIALHRTYGTPYIPGSALKGLASHYAMNHLETKSWGKDSPAFKVLFGDTTSAGYVTFFDALYVPGSGHREKPLWPDVITVHHPDYYQGQASPPADWDNPTPIPFLTATGSFMLALSGPAGWVDKTFEILALALENEGIGAKTSSGYGRMKLDVAQTGEMLREPPGKALAQKIAPPGYHRGTVKEFGLGSNKSFGYITPEEGGRLFVHEKNVHPAIGKLQAGMKVIFKIGQGPKGPMAVDVCLDK